MESKFKEGNTKKRQRTVGEASIVGSYYPLVSFSVFNLNSSCDVPTGRKPGFPSNYYPLVCACKKSSSFWVFRLAKHSYCERTFFGKGKSWRVTHQSPGSVLWEFCVSIISIRISNPKSILFTLERGPDSVRLIIAFSRLFVLMWNPAVRNRARSFRKSEHMSIIFVFSSVVRYPSPPRMVRKPILSISDIYRCVKHTPFRNECITVLDSRFVTNFPSRNVSLIGFHCFPAVSLNFP